jgi:glycine oxidase
MTADVVIVGGGVIGLSIAYRLAREGVVSKLLDRRELGREASWAGAGLIAANTERLRGNPTVELRSWSAALYPEWSGALLEETGVDNGYRRTGGIDLAETEEDEHALRATAGRWRTEGIVFERLTSADLARIEPALARNLRAAYFLPDRAQVRNPRHLRALALAASQRGAQAQPGWEVTGFVTQGDRVTTVQTVHGAVACGTLVVAAGAWTSGLLDGIGVRVPTPPLKGQIVLLRSDPPILRRIIELGKNYIVPRDDGRTLIGATEEETGFDTRTTAQGVRELIDLAMRLCPGLAVAEVERSWAGLRPGSMDTRPFIGPLPGYSNTFVATGHKRAGLQLSPATAEVMTDLILGRSPGMDLSSFRLDREASDDEDDAFRS